MRGWTQSSLRTLRGCVEMSALGRKSWRRRRRRELASRWKLLAEFGEAGYGNAGAPPQLLEKAELRRMTCSQQEEDAQPCVGAWAAYATRKAYIAPTPAEEAAARIVRKRSLGSFSVGFQELQGIAKKNVPSARRV